MEGNIPNHMDIERIAILLQTLRNYHDHLYNSIDLGELYLHMIDNELHRLRSNLETHCTLANRRTLEGRYNSLALERISLRDILDECYDVLRNIECKWLDMWQTFKQQFE